MKVDQDKPSIRFVGQTDFALEVLQADKPVLAVFIAPWSRACQVLEVTLNDVLPACDGRVQVVKVNADDQPDLSLWYDIQSIPTLLYFVAGRVQAKVVGTASKEAILAKLNLPKA
jgi:thioredoxin 1